MISHKCNNMCGSCCLIVGWYGRYFVILLILFCLFRKEGGDSLVGFHSFNTVKLLDKCKLCHVHSCG